MKNFGRLVELHRLLVANRGVLSGTELQSRLQCSRATVMRLLNELRDVTRDPIPYDRDRGGYCYQEPEKHRSGLPSLWFSPSELYALLVIRHQLREMQPGFLSEALAPLGQRLSELLRCDGVSAEEIARRIHLISHSRRSRISACCFPQCAEAVLHRRRLAIRYHSRISNLTTEREISPYRLVAYRENWYLDAWCHVRHGLRRFAVDRVEAARVLDIHAMPTGECDLDDTIDPGYGIFSGPANTKAVLRFSVERARWVADEIWHVRQHGHFLPDGRYELTVPYGEPAELIMEILKYGPDVEVIAPDELKRSVAARLRAALQRYSDA